MGVTDCLIPSVGRTMQAGEIWADARVNYSKRSFANHEDGFLFRLSLSLSLSLLTDGSYRLFLASDQPFTSPARNSALMHHGNGMYWPKHVSLSLSF